ncbi:unnamed protein product [Caenorhabditis bovis]|uniref:Uncharacterized protein n=1 Tax=Caenorhabditis bovis TaxID=2654633 RepID=A0A8S1EZS9_9PELO|nr:unnamed protein product [Caenorhabditis bovis]
MIRQLIVAILVVGLLTISAHSFYIAQDGGDDVWKVPQQDVLENIVSEMMSVQSVGPHQVRRQIFSRKFW